MSESMSWEALYPGRAPEDGPPSAEECATVARAVLERGYPQTTLYGSGSASDEPKEESAT